MTVLKPHQAERLANNMKGMLNTIHTNNSACEISARNMVVDEDLTQPRIVDLSTLSSLDRTKKMSDKKRLESILDTVSKYEHPVST